MANPIRKITDRIGGNWFFLVLVVFAYLIIYFLNLELLKKSFSAASNIFIEMIPTIIIVFGLIFVFNFLFSSDFILKYLGKTAGHKGWLIAVIFGILSSGPIYMWYPLLKDLKSKGMREGYITAFLYNRAVKIPLLSMMVFYFGWVLVLILNFYMIIFSVINGYIVEKIIFARGATPADGQGFASGEKRKEKI